MVHVSTSQVVQDQSAVPPVKTNQLEKGGVMRVAAGYLAAADFTGGTVGEWYTFVRLPARARVTGIFLTGATTTSGAVKCGLYRPDGIAIDDNVFATNYNMAVKKDRANILVIPTALERTQSLSEAYATAIGTAGATGDAEFDIALTILTALGAGADHLLEVDYILPE